MKNILLLISLIFFNSFYLQNKENILTPELRQEIEIKSERLQPEHITFRKLDKKLNGKRFKMPSTLFSVLNNREMFDYDSAVVIGHFITKNNFIGIICYDKVYECDHPSDRYSLYVAGKNGKLSEQLIIKYEDNEITTYEIDFKFITNALIQISQKTSSEYAIEPDSQTDTIVTATYKINFLKTPFDTLDRKISTEIIRLK
jgi:hypothetical protein